MTTAGQIFEGALVAERFRLVRELGRGGMGTVWLAHHLGLDVPCAIKLIDGEARSEPDTRARVEREAQSAAQLRSPHVVTILDHGIWEEIPYIAMEYLEGEDLASRLDRLERLDFTATYRIVAHVARALTKAHAAGIVHRDLKPENIFLVEGDEGEIAKVVDFGIAKRDKYSLVGRGTKSGSLLGTPFYMSPEQARATRAVDHRSDLWSLGVIAFQCLTGALPFSSDGLGDLLSQIIFDPIPMPSQVARDLPASFDVWWLRASARNPEDRFQTAKELADALLVALRLQQIQTIASMPARATLPSLPDTGGGLPLPGSIAPPPHPGLTTTGKSLSRTFPHRNNTPAARPAQVRSAIWIGLGVALVTGVIATRSADAVRPGSAAPIAAAAGAPKPAAFAPDLPSMQPPAANLPGTAAAAPPTLASPPPNSSAAFALSRPPATAGGKHPSLPATVVPLGSAQKNVSPSARPAPAPRPAARPQAHGAPPAGAPNADNADNVDFGI